MPPMRYSHNNLPCDEYRRRICARTRILYKKARCGSNLITYGQVQITYGQVQIRSHMKAAPAFMIAWKYHDPHKRSSAFT
ncbi:hypothetical protein GCWU000342_00377 [Shuttleworthella satelles DSM 14600]|uniref:Uncharacterized protein n=1 Tax=Shuttleworthella satelles DSM 14600 TaxID=626523 RepID=C4G8T0_9FIRM|nr:hypothetical protein GCWU000342_00377 [Shuttleworthia satelles DSM 14600]